jgi:hypothetical protein
MSSPSAIVLCVVVKIFGRGTLINSKFLTLGSCRVKYCTVNSIEEFKEIHKRMLLRMIDTCAEKGTPEFQNNYYYSIPRC